MEALLMIGVVAAVVAAGALRGRRRKGSHRSVDTYNRHPLNQIQKIR